MEVGLVLLVLFLFMFVQGVLLAMIMMKLSDLSNSHASLEDLDHLSRQIEELRDTIAQSQKPQAKEKSKTKKKPVTRAKKTTK
ncbi:MAG: hypothetical protein ABUK01_02070 [Leptospirales bacterium]